jgi:hypothetical protein
LRTGWTWDDLERTPQDVVDDLVALLVEQSREASQAAAQQQAVRPSRRRR